MGEIYDVVIVGSGPAGLSAAVYAKRAGLNMLVLEQAAMSGGQILNTYEVDNYPGVPKIGGFDLAVNMREHAKSLGAAFATDTVGALEDGFPYKTLRGEKGSYKARSVILANGARHRLLGVPGEEKLTGHGVSYCATCDGMFFKDKTVAVVGGGDTAIGDAILLSRTCGRVYLIHRRDKLRGAGSLQKQLFSLENVTFLPDTEVAEITGETVVTGLRIRNKKDGKETGLSLQGVFIAVGIIPETEVWKNLVETDKAGYIRAGEDGVTSVPGIFAAGDIRTKPLRQVVTAAADGANAVISAERYLSENMHNESI